MADLFRKKPVTYDNTDHGLKKCLTALDRSSAPDTPENNIFGNSVYARPMMVMTTMTSSREKPRCRMGISREITPKT